MIDAPVVLLGGGEHQTAFSKVNAMIFKGLSARGVDVRSDLKPDLRNFVVIHHNFLEDFQEVVFPPADIRVAFRPWDFGPYPPAWVSKINAETDQLWVYCNWAREKAIEGGVRADMVHVVPLGVDLAVTGFPEGQAYPFSKKAAFRFLFVGAAVHRKGMDILLEAYRRYFSAGDDVCLVIKDHTRDVFYDQQSYRDQIHGMVEDSSGPAVEYIDSYLPEDQLSELIRSCDVGVYPYRAEGFALPVLELMARGLPCIVPRFGPCLDYSSDDSAYFVEAERIKLPLSRKLPYNTLGFQVDVAELDFCEVPVDVLGKQMRAVYSHPEGIAEKGYAAQKRARSFTWAHTVDRMLYALS